MQQSPFAPPTKLPEDIAQHIRELIDRVGCTKPRELVEELIVTSLKLGVDQTSVADLKMLTRSLRELRFAARVFAPFSQCRKISVFGSARTPDDAPESRLAAEFSRKMVEAGFMVMTGAGDGIMGAAQHGAGRERSFGLNIRLPFEQRSNDTIHGDDKLMTFNYFFTRKLNFVKESDAFALFPGGFGTMDEAFEVLTLIQTGKARVVPIVLLDVPGSRYWESWIEFIREKLLGPGLVSPEDFSFFRAHHDVDVAVAEVAGFYRLFHSYRLVGQRICFRLQHPLPESAVSEIGERFSDIVDPESIVQSGALPEEADEPELASLARVTFAPRKKKFGRLRQLIDFVNEQEPE